MPKMEPSIPRKPWGLDAHNAWFFSVPIFWLSQFLGILPNFASLDYLKVGFFVPLLSATVLTIGFGIVLGIVLYLTRKRTNRWRWGFLLLMTAVSLGWMFWSWSETTPRKKFAHRVLNPVPLGVQEIVARGYTTFGSQWSFEFQADSAALDSIISHHQMTPQPLEALAEYREDRFAMVPPWILTATDADGMKIFQRYTPESMSPEPRRARTLWLAYFPGQPRAWFWYDAPM